MGHTEACPPLSVFLCGFTTISLLLLLLFFLNENSELPLPGSSRVITLDAARDWDRLKPFWGGLLCVVCFFVLLWLSFFSFSFFLNEISGETVHITQKGLKP